MVKLKTTQSGLKALRDSVFKMLFRARFRYDVFISYNHRAKAYAVSLKKQLAELDFTCFIDEEEAPPGSALDPTLAKALKKSAVLVLLATERALTRPYITLEFEKFVATGRRIIPINICGALTVNEEAALALTPWNVIKSRNLIWIDEADEAFAQQVPSPPIADGIDKLFKYTRRNSRVRTEIIGTALLVVLAAIGAGFVIKGQAAEVSKQAERARTATVEADKQQGIATQAGREAQRQLTLAAQATNEAKRQQGLANTAKKEAERQQEISRTATAEADRQLALAEAAKTEAARQQERSRHLNYDSDMGLAYRAYEAGDIVRVSQLLDASVPPAAAPKGDLRGFEWYYLRRLSHKEIGSLNDKSREILSITFSPDSKRVATASDNGVVKLWDVLTGRELSTLSKDWSINYLAFSPDGKKLAGAGVDNTVRLWDMRTMEQTAIVVGHGQQVFSVAFSPDGRKLATGSMDGTAKLWDLNTLRELATLRGHKSYVFSVAFSIDGAKLATGGWDSTVKLWDVATFKELASEERRHGPHVNSVAFSPDGKLLATGCGVDGDWNNTVRLWDASTLKELGTLKGQTNHVTSVAFSSDSKLLAAASESGVVKIWDTGTTEEVATISGQIPHLKSIAFSPDGETLAGSGGAWPNGTDGPKGLFWDAGALKEKVTVRDNPFVVQAIAVSPDGKTIAVSRVINTGFGKDVELWDARSMTPRTKIRADGFGVLAMAFSPDGRILATGGGSNRVNLWNAETLKLLKSFEGHDRHSAGVLSVAFSPDGKLIASGGSDTTIKLWDVNRQREVATLKGHTADVSSLAFSPDGSTLASGDWAQTVKLWDLRTAKARVTLKTKIGQINSVLFSYDGRLLVAGGDVVKVWDANTLNELATLSAFSPVFAPDRKTLVGLSKQTLKFWDVSNWQELTAVRGPSSFSALAFSPTQDFLITGDDNGSLSFLVSARK